MNKNYLVGLCALLVLVGFPLLGHKAEGPTNAATSTSPLATSTTPSTDITQSAYGTKVFGVGDLVTFKYVTLKLLSVADDSRCPQGVQCVWAGTAKAKLHISNPSGNYEREVELGKSFTTENETVEFVSLTPAPKAGQSISQDSYRVTLKVTLKSDIKVGGCFVGGCSGQLCSDQPNMASTCEWTESYACYKTAKCERQASGQCGWTSTPELNMCLAEAR